MWLRRLVLLDESGQVVAIARQNRAGAVYWDPPRICTVLSLRSKMHSV